MLCIHFSKSHGCEVHKSQTNLVDRRKHYMGAQVVGHIEVTQASEVEAVSKTIPTVGPEHHYGTTPYAETGAGHCGGCRTSIATDQRGIT